MSNKNIKNIKQKLESDNWEILAWFAQKAQEKIWVQSNTEKAKKLQEAFQLFTQLWVVSKELNSNIIPEVLDEYKNHLKDESDALFEIMFGKDDKRRFTSIFEEIKKILWRPLENDWEIADALRKIKKNIININQIKTENEKISIRHIDLLLEYLDNSSFKPNIYAIMMDNIKKIQRYTLENTINFPKVNNKMPLHKIIKKLENDNIS